MEGWEPGKGPGRLFFPAERGDLGLGLHGCDGDVLLRGWDWGVGRDVRCGCGVTLTRVQRGHRRVWGDFTLLTPPLYSKRIRILMINRNQSQQGPMGPRPSSPGVCPAPSREKSLLHKSSEAGIPGSQRERSSPRQLPRGILTCAMPSIPAWIQDNPTAAQAVPGLPPVPDPFGALGGAWLSWDVGSLLSNPCWALGDGSMPAVGMSQAAGLGHIPSPGCVPSWQHLRGAHSPWVSQLWVPSLHPRGSTEAWVGGKCVPNVSALPKRLRCGRIWGCSAVTASPGDNPSERAVPSAAALGSSCCQIVWEPSWEL